MNLAQQGKDALNDLSTILDWIRWSASKMAEYDVYFGHGTDNPWDEATALVLFAIHFPLDTPADVFSSKLTQEEKHRILTLLSLRIDERKPLAYITNSIEFCGLPFYVDERVLVPRSPLGEVIQQQFAGIKPANEIANVLDLCTGSGCIAIACANYLPNAFVTASDISVDALEVAQINVSEHMLEERVGLIQSDVFDSIPHQQFDIIISNPPYVDAEDLSLMPEEYHQEPEIGLGSGNDGLDITRRILKDADKYLSDKGVLIVEVGNSWPALRDAYPEVDFTWLRFENGGDGVFMLTKDQLTAFSL